MTSFPNGWLVFRFDMHRSNALVDRLTLGIDKCPKCQASNETKKHQPLTTVEHTPKVKGRFFIVLSHHHYRRHAHLTGVLILTNLIVVGFHDNSPRTRCGSGGRMDIHKMFESTSTQHCRTTSISKHIEHSRNQISLFLGYYQYTSQKDLDFAGCKVTTRRVSPTRPLDGISPAKFDTFVKYVE